MSPAPEVVAALAQCRTYLDGLREALPADTPITHATALMQARTALERAQHAATASLPLPPVAYGFRPCETDEE